MYDFWCSLLLNEHSYKGNAMDKHIALSQRTPMQNDQFGIWLQLFRETVHENFSGTKAKEAIQKAEQIATLIQQKITK